MVSHRPEEALGSQEWATYLAWFDANTTHFARTTDEYLQWYINRGQHPDLEAIKSMYKVEVVTMPYIIKLEMALFGRTIEQVEIHDPVQGDIISQLFKMEG